MIHISDLFDSKIILPLIGVFIGWFLTSISGYFKGISEKKKILAKTLLQLHFLFMEQRKIIGVFELLKNTHGIGTEYEKMRMKSMERYAINDESYKSILQVVHDLSSVYPLTAMKLKTLVESYAFHQKVSLAQSSKLQGDLYIRLLSAFEVTFELENKALKQIILKISFGHGIITWLKMKNKYKNLEKTSNINDLSKEIGIEDELKKIVVEQRKEKIEK